MPSQIPLHRVFALLAVAALMAACESDNATSPLDAQHSEVGTHAVVLPPGEGEDPPPVIGTDPVYDPEAALVAQQTTRLESEVFAVLREIEYYEQVVPTDLPRIDSPEFETYVLAKPGCWGAFARYLAWGALAGWQAVSAIRIMSVKGFDPVVADALVVGAIFSADESYKYYQLYRKLQASEPSKVWCTGS